MQRSKLMTANVWLKNVKDLRMSDLSSQKTLVGEDTKIRTDGSGKEEVML